MSLYPTLEDMKVDNLAQAQNAYIASVTPSAPNVQPPPYSAPVPAAAGGQEDLGLYPSLGDFMGLSMVQAQSLNMQPTAPNHARTIAVSAPVSQSGIVGIKRSEIKPGVTQVTLCKDARGFVGLRVRDINKGVFVQVVTKDSPAAMGGLRFGDQILSINDELVAGYSVDKVHKILKKCPVNGIRIAVRERPFERTVTLTKDSGGITGFGFQDGKIVSIMKDSSAARNGILVDHQLVEINGQNVIGLKDSKMRDMMTDGGDVVTVTLMPSFLYDHVMKKMGSSILKLMDHSVPEC